MNKASSEISPESVDENKKRQYFIRLSFQDGVREAMRLHKKVENFGSGKAADDWRNVVEHCLVEVARTDVLAEVLGLSESVRAELITAAALHDVGKANEIAAFINANENSESAWDACTRASNDSGQLMVDADFPVAVIALASVAGDHNSFRGTLRVTQQVELTPQDIARLVMSYVDDMTQGNDWVKPATPRDDGSLENDVDRRLAAGEGDERYERMNREARNHFDGRTMYEMQRETVSAVEQRLAQLIGEVRGEAFDPKQLPEFIDQLVGERIAMETLSGTQT